MQSISRDIANCLRQAQNRRRLPRPLLKARRHRPELEWEDAAAPFRQTDQPLITLTAGVCPMKKLQRSHSLTKRTVCKDMQQVFIHITLAARQK